jgi:hypothetical protein
MFKKFAVLSLLVLVAGCHRKNDDGSPANAGATLPGMPGASVTHYSGAIQTLTGCGQTCTQTVNVNADVIDHPTDVVDVYLCKNATCSIGNIPAQVCSWGQAASQPCYTTMPFVDITLGHGTVGFVQAFEIAYADAAHLIVLSTGYNSYAISTTILR